MSNQFNKTLRSIVDSQGEGIILDKKLVNILSDYDGFIEIPAAKYILKNLLEDGTIAKYIKLGVWGNKCKQFVTKVANKTGFQPEILTDIFVGIAFGLGWINDTNYSQSSNKSNTKDKVTSGCKLTTKSYSNSDLLNILRRHKFIYTKGGKFGIMNYAGEIIHEAIYNEIDEYPSAGLIPVRKGKRWGYIDSESYHFIEPQFNEVDTFSDERAIVKCTSLSENDYVINRDGDMVIPPIYDCISRFSYGLAKVVIDNLQGYIDVDGEIKVPIEYPFPPQSIQTEEEILFTTDYGTRIVDKENNIKAFFNEIYFGSFNSALGNGKFIVRQYHDDDSATSGVIDNHSKIIIPCRYDDLTPIKDFGSGQTYLKAKLGKKFGILSVNGKMLVPFQFDEIEVQTSQNQFIVKKKDKWGTVGVDGKTKIPFMYDEISYIWDDGYDVILGSKKGRINAANEWIVDSSPDFPISDDYDLFDTIFDENENKIYLCHKGRSAYIFNEQGNELLKFNCPDITETIN